MNEIMSKQEHSSRKQAFVQNDFQQRPGSTTPRLRYYDNPPDPAEGIIIPLHTPPDEKESVTFASSIVAAQPTVSAQPATNKQQITTTVDIIESSPKPRTPIGERQLKQPITKSVVSTSTTPTASAQPKIKKPYRIELPDGSIRIPLRSPSDERAENDDGDNNSQLWSTAVQRNSSQESQDTVISSKAASLVSAGDIQVNKSSVISTVVAIQPITTAVEPKLETPSKQISQEETVVVSVENANGGIRALSKERKRILFSTKIGSGSEEQIFATQLSLSKTESLSSQLSEQVPNLESPSTDKTEKCESIPRDEQKQQAAPQTNEPVVRMRSKEDKEPTDAVQVVKQEIINVNRHSMYIENIDEVLETQRRIESEKKSAKAKDQRLVERNDEQRKQSGTPVKPERASKSASLKNRESTEERRSGAGSSESEHDSEMDAKV